MRGKVDIRAPVILTGRLKEPDEIAEKTNLTLWLDCADLTTLFKDGGITPATLTDDVVDQVTDKSGQNGHNFRLADAGPQLKLSRLNGKPGLYYNGSNPNSVGPIMDHLITADAYTLFVVFKAGTITTNLPETYLNNAVVADNGGYWGVYLKTAPSVHLYNYDAGGDKKTTHNISTAAHILMGYHSAGSLYSSIDDGTLTSAASSNTGSLAGFCRIALGCNTDYTEMDFHELVIYNVELTASSRAMVMKYLKKKWVFL